ncbi:MAG: DUF3592 domain-containing protein [Lachnospiraceae bacterium]|nr:DUF3592 domain-containing protein [Lachnospiraceae bacterium]
MAKKVFGIILTVLGGIFLLMALIFGLVFGGIGTAMNSASNSGVDYSQDSNYASCKGEVIDVDDSKTSVQYEADGDLYIVELNMTNSAYPVGTAVTVYYNKVKPEECSVPEIAEATFGTIGGVFSGVGIGLFICFTVIGIAGLISGILLIRSSAHKTDTPQE